MLWNVILSVGFISLIVLISLRHLIFLKEKGLRGSLGKLYMDTARWCFAEFKSNQPVLGKVIIPKWEVYKARHHHRFFNHCERKNETRFCLAAIIGRVTLFIMCCVESGSRLRPESLSSLFFWDIIGAITIILNKLLALPVCFAPTCFQITIAELLWCRRKKFSWIVKPACLSAKGIPGGLFMTDMWHADPREGASQAD